MSKRDPPPHKTVRGKPGISCWGYDLSVYTIVFLVYNFCLCEWSATQSCLTLHNFMDCSPPCSSIHGNLQARILEWVAICFSRGSSDPGTELISLVSLALVGKFFIAKPPGKHIKLTYPHIFINLSPSYTTFAYDFLLSIVFSPEDVFLIFFSPSNNSSNVIASIKFI